MPYQIILQEEVIISGFLYHSELNKHVGLIIPVLTNPAGAVL